MLDCMASGCAMYFVVHPKTERLALAQFADQLDFWGAASRCPARCKNLIESCERAKVKLYNRIPNLIGFGIPPGV